MAEAQAPAILERALRRDRLIVGAMLAATAALAWLWLWRLPMAHAADPWSAGYLGPAILMWALMMVAMMLPSAAPMILLYARCARRWTPHRALADTALFALVYVLLWGLFSLAAAAAQAWLAATGALSAMELRLGDAGLAAAFLALAGLYQLTPARQACLARCRSPLALVVRLWRPGAAGAARLGLAHGLYCLGCCWALMALLFVGGVMSFAWIGGIALLVLAEKLAPAGVAVGRAAGAAMLLAAVLGALAA